MEYTLSIHNKKVFDFYKRTNLDFETTNLLFMDIMEKLMDSSVNANITNNLIEKLNILDIKMENINNMVSKSQNEISTMFGVKLNEYRKEYIDDLKRTLSTNNIEQIIPLMKESNIHFMDKTTLLFNEIIPKGQEVLYKDLSIQFQQFHSSITEKTNTLLSSSIDKTNLDHFLTSLNQTMNHSQQTMTNLISSSETRIENRLIETERKMNDIKELSNTSHLSYQTLQTNVSDMLKKFEKGVGKGSISEHILYNILLGMYPCASELDKVSDELKETGDIMFQSRSDKPRILIENKDHESINVPKVDVDKFLRDCNKHNCCGILLSQHRGIANKEDFEIKINGKNVLLYVHKVKFDVDKIKLAIDIVEHFKTELDMLYTNENDNNENYIIEASIMENINNEYIYFKNQKLNMLKIIKDCCEKMSTGLNELKLPNLDNYLCIHFGSSSNQNDTICKYCNKHVPKSLLQHYRYCKSKQTSTTNEIIVNTDTMILPNVSLENDTEEIFENNNVLMENLIETQVSSDTHVSKNSKKKAKK
jgi:hypothetical protein